ASSLAVISGNLDLNGATRNFTIADGAPIADLDIFGAISGTGSEGLNKSGPGTLLLEGSANTYTGPTTVSGGLLDLAKGVAVPGDLIINSGAAVREELSNEIADTSAVTVNSGGNFDLSGRSDTVRAVTVARGTLTTGAASVGRLTAGNTSFDT